MIRKSTHIRLLLAAAAVGMLLPLSVSRTAAQDGTVAGQELESVLGREVRTRDEDMGRIVDLLADRSGNVKAAVIELGGFLGIGTRKIAVEWSALQFDGSGKQPVNLDMTRDQLRLAPEFKSAEPVVVRRIEY